MIIETICALCIEAIRNAGYNESTIRNYERLIGRFKLFCKEKEIIEYSCDIGQQFANDVITKRSGKFSLNRYHTQGRFIRLVDSYFNTNEFDFSINKRGKVSPDNPKHKIDYEEYQCYLHSTYTNKNTIHFYEYGMYCLLQFLNNHDITELKLVKIDIVFQYIKEAKLTRQREVLCELRGIFRYLERTDILTSLMGIHAPRLKRIICTLRDAAIVIMGLSCGIRSCDLIKLKLSDVNWVDESITFTQSKTGNLVCLPLTSTVGNALARYISEERPHTENTFLFLRELAPFTPLSGHASCYRIVSNLFQKAGIEKGNRIFGMHMLRHNAASTMVKNEVPMETIATILGHSSPDTTDIYITTDEKSLKDCVLPMNEISRKINL